MSPAETLRRLRALESKVILAEDDVRGLRRRSARFRSLGLAGASYSRPSTGNEFVENPIPGNIVRVKVVNKWGTPIEGIEIRHGYAEIVEVEEDVDGYQEAVGSTSGPSVFTGADGMADCPVGSPGASGFAVIFGAVQRPFGMFQFGQYVEDDEPDIVILTDVEGGTAYEAPLGTYSGSMYVPGFDVPMEFRMTVLGGTYQPTRISNADRAAIGLPADWEALGYPANFYTFASGSYPRRYTKLGFTDADGFTGNNIYQVGGATATGPDGTLTQIFLTANPDGHLELWVLGFNNCPQAGGKPALSSTPPPTTPTSPPWYTVRNATHSVTDTIVVPTTGARAIDVSTTPPLMYLNFLAGPHVVTFTHQNDADPY